MSKGKRAVAVLALIAVAGAAGFDGTQLTSPKDSDAAAYTTETVNRGTVAQTVSASGNLVDAYVYSLAPKSTPVLIEKAGVKVGNAPSAQGYTTYDLRVQPGDTVKKNEKLAVVKNADGDKTNVKAPFKGTVRTVTTAEKASAAQVATLSVGAKLVSVEVSEYDLAKVKKGQHVSLQLSASSSAIGGEVRSIAQTVDSTSGVQKYQVLIKTDELPRTARAGMSVTATIRITSASNALSVSAAAVTTSGGVSTVRVLNGQGSAVVTKVKTGLVGDRDVEITSGLRAGDIVITGASGEVPATSTSGFPGAPGGAS